jgi:2-polyprenyl-3-methyl-5-hydroxy-6-metoxy-1,4-benzoquinol methylase
MSTMVSIKDSTVDVEELKKRIRERLDRIRNSIDFVPIEEVESKKQDASGRQQGELSALSRAEAQKFGSRRTELVVEQRNLATDKKVIAPIIMKLHKMVDREVQWLLEPTMARVTEVINSLLADVDSLRTTQTNEMEQVNNKINSLLADVDSLRTTQTNEMEQVNNKINSLLADVNYLKATQAGAMERIQTEIDQLKSRTGSLEGRLAGKQLINYAVHRTADGIVITERIIENAYALRNLPANIKRILDVGCCESDLSIQLATMGFEVYGIDVRNYELSHRNFHFVRDDIMHTPFQDRYFDVVIAISALEHIGTGHYGDPHYSDGDLKAMEEIRRILKDGGLLIMSTPFGAKAKVTWERVYDSDSVSSLLKDFNVQRAEYWLKEGEEWRIASLDEAKLQDHDIRPFGDAYPLWPCIVTLIASKPLDR